MSGRSAPRDSFKADNVDNVVELVATGIAGLLMSFPFVAAYRVTVTSRGVSNHR